MSKSRFAQSVHFVNAVASPATADDLFNTNLYSDVVNLSNYDKCTFVLSKNAGATGTATITVSSCDDTTPTTETAIPFTYWVCTSGDTFGDATEATAAGFTTTAGTNQVYVIEVNSSELYGTNKYVRLVGTEVVNSPVTGGLTCIMSGPRFTSEVMKTAIV